MKILIALPDKEYYVWQMLVQINNFIKFGFNNKIIFIIGKTGKELPDSLKKIINTKNIGCEFHVFNDNRKNLKYPVTLRLYLLSKFFQKFPAMEKEMFFYTDPDVIFTDNINFAKYYEDKIWYMSDVKSYIGHEYIKSKSIDLFYEMCDIVGISPDVVEKNENNVGGAQHIIKNVKTEFWNKVMLDSEKLYSHMIATSKKYSPEKPIQNWTADMWGFLWNCWYFGYESKVDPELDFSWATSPIDEWKNKKIYHNAGVINNENHKYFNKMDYQISPFNKNITCSSEYCGFNYIKEITETAENYNNLIF